ncbi:MAG: EF-hand domain-containing protein [Elsteraceae bacterium]
MTSAISGSSLAAQFAQSIFKKADANNDGQLTADELDAAKPSDASSDGPSGADLVKAGDKDGDGKLSQAELEGALKATQSKLADSVQLLLLALQEQGEAGTSRERSFAEALFKEADADNDGQLTETELSAARPKDAPAGAPSATDLIKAGDANGDGKLNQAELEKALQTLRPGAGDNVAGASDGSLAASLSQNATDSIGDLLDSLLKALDENKDGEINQTDIDALRKKAQAADDNAAATNGGSQGYNLTIAATAQSAAGVGSTSYAKQTASLSILLKFQEAA